MVCTYRLSFCRQTTSEAMIAPNDLTAPSHNSHFVYTLLRHNVKDLMSSRSLRDQVAFNPPQSNHLWESWINDTIHNELCEIVRS